MGTKEQERQALPQARFVCQGEYWTLAFEARLIRLKDSKGLRQLEILLREPGREFHVLDLMARIDPSRTSASRIKPWQLAELTVRSALGEDGGEPVDAQARAEYKQRVVELKEELEEAREFGDKERIARIEDEIDQVEHELKNAYGFGGRSRKARSAADQARVNVTKNIGRALDQIEAKHQSLGRLLKATVKTGIFCSYLPDSRFPVSWSFEGEQSSDALSSAEPDQRSGKAQSGAPASATQLEQRQPADGRLVWGRFIGRAQEMATLRAAIDAAFGGHASLVMLVGDAGIGKTRLAEEAGEYARLRGAQVLVGRCYEGEAASPYSPFVEVVCEYISTRPDDTLRAEMGDTAPELAKLVPEIRQRISDLPPPQAGGQEVERTRLFDSVASFLVNASKVNPIMLHLEDLHWADKASLQLLQHLARRLKGSRFTVVGTYRDVEVDRSHPLSTMLAELRRERLYERVLLRGLSESEVKELIQATWQQQVGGGPGEAFVRAILHETEGNPFFIEEVLRHLVESGGMYRRDGSWVADLKAIDEMGVPEDVRDVIGRRLARLSETTNRVLEGAAVLGREFEFEVLSCISGLGEDTMVPAVEEALSHRIVLESQDRGRPRYMFTHWLVRQTLYEELSLPRRQQLHLKAAQAIEAAHEHSLEPHLAALANHCRRAGTAADPKKAIDYSIRAGRAAYALFAYEEAEAHWRAALAIMDEQGGGDRKRRAELLWLLGDTLVSGDARAVEYMEAAATLYEELGDNQAACEVHSRIGLYLSATFALMDLRRAMPHFTKAEAFLVKQPESAAHALFYLSMAGVYIWTLRIGDGLAAGKRAMEISERLDPPALRDGLWCAAAVLRSHLLILSGSVSEGLRLADQARRRVPIDDTMTGSTVAQLGGGNYLRLADPREAEDWYTHELAKRRTARSAIRGALLQYRLVDAYIDMGELTKARACLAEANAEKKPEGLVLFDNEAKLLVFEGQWELAVKTMTAEVEGAAASGACLADLLVARDLAGLRRLTGEGAEALQLLQKALDISSEAGDIVDELKTRSTLATTAADAGDAGDALPHLHRCRQIVGAGENWFGIAGMVERAEAGVAAAQGKLAIAETHFEKAIATFQKYCLPWEEADTLQYWGRALLTAGQPARAIEKFDAEIEIYRSRGAGARFIEYVVADKKRAQDSKSAV